MRSAHGRAASSRRAWRIAWLAPGAAVVLGNLANNTAAITTTIQ